MPVFLFCLNHGLDHYQWPAGHFLLLRYVLIGMKQLHLVQNFILLRNSQLLQILIRFARSVVECSGGYGLSVFQVAGLSDIHFKPCCSIKTTYVSTTTNVVACRIAAVHLCSNTASYVIRKEFSFVVPSEAPTNF